MIKNGSTNYVKSWVKDEDYFDNEFIDSVAQRGAEIIKKTGKSSGASAASATCDHMHDWWYGNLQGGYVSMGVIPEESHYGISPDICYSYPCQIENGEWKIVKNLKIDEFSKQKMKDSEEELLKEMKAIEYIFDE